MERQARKWGLAPLKRSKVQPSGNKKPILVTTAENWVWPKRDIKVKITISVSDLFFQLRLENRDIWVDAVWSAAFQAGPNLLAAFCAFLTNFWHVRPRITWGASSPLTHPGIQAIVVGGTPNTYSCYFPSQKPYIFLPITGGHCAK